MLDSPLIPTAANTSRSDTTAGRPIPADEPASERKNGDFEKEMAAQTNEDTAAGQRGRTENAPSASTKNQTRDTSVVGQVDSETAEILPEVESEQPEEQHAAATVRSPAADTSPEAPVLRGKTTSELAVLQQAGPGITEKKAPESNRTDPAETTPRSVSAEQKPAERAGVLPAGGATQQSTPGSLVRFADLKSDDPATGAQKQNAANISAAVSVPVASASVQETARLAVPGGTAATLATEKPGRRSEILRSSDTEPRSMPTPAAARADMRNTASAIAMQPVNPATVHANQVAARDNPDLVMPSVQDADTMLQWDPRAAGSSTAQQAILRAETPGMIGRQMAEALQRLPDRPVELALSPRELGKVRMTISAAEGSITVNVLAERPETLDLMRRNIDELAREFQALGFETISFAFSEGQQQTNEDHSDDAPRVTETDTAHHSDPAETADAPVRLVESTGLDLRL